MRLRFLRRQAAGSSKGFGPLRSTHLAQGAIPGTRAPEASARGKRTRSRHRRIELEVPHSWVQDAELGKERIRRAEESRGRSGEGRNSRIPSPRATVQVRDGYGWGSALLGTKKPGAEGLPTRGPAQLPSRPLNSGSELAYVHAADFPGFVLALLPPL